MGSRTLCGIAGGTLVGLALGYLSAGLFVRSDDPLSSILLTLAVALGAFQIGHIWACPVWWLWLSLG